MLDEENVTQQEALGVVGVNLLYGAFYHRQPERLISSLQENIAPVRIEVDLIKFSGPAFEGIDNRLMSLQLVSQGLTNAVMFTADGEMVQPAEIFHKKAILVERGSFRPVTYATNDMLDGARRIFLKQSGCSEKDLVVLMEMTLENLLAGAYLSRSARDDQRRLEKCFALFPQLAARKEQIAGTLSGGEQQMVAIGRALMARPKLLMLDEPSMGLAPIFVEKIFEIVREINEQGTTILLVEQNALMALDAADRGYVLETGRVALADDAKKLRENEQVQKTYLGIEG